MGKYQIHQVAQSFGGGGHPFAAGAVIRKSMDEVAELVVSETIKSMDSQIDG